MKESYEIRQALIATGGQGNRLRSGGVEFPLSKPFIEVEGEPLLYWAIKELLDAQVQDFILAAETREKLQAAEKVFDKATAGQLVKEVVFFQDPGLGANGLPYQARNLLHENFIFQFGHHLVHSAHFQELRKMKKPQLVVFTGFRVEGHSNHPTSNVNLDTHLLQEDSNNAQEFEIAAPYVLDHMYVAGLPQHEFRFHRIVQERAKTQSAAVVACNFPIEFDTLPEYTFAITFYHSYIRPQP